MLLLIFAEDLENSPVKADWSLEARSQLAGMLCRTLKQHAGKAEVLHCTLLLLQAVSADVLCHPGVVKCRHLPKAS